MENSLFDGAPDIVLSLIICSKNRAQGLKRCLEYVRENRPPFAWELILVDNGSTDETKQVMLDFIAALPVPAKYIYEAKRGNGAGRNEGIRQCRGGVVAFTDDDCYLDSEFLAGVERIFRDPKVGYMSGRIMLFDPTDMAITINESLQEVVVSEAQITPGGIIQGANMAFRKAPLEAVGMFDPLFGAGSTFAGEDWELAMRISANGWKGGYYPGPVVWHHHGRKADAAGKLHIFYCEGEGALYAKGLLNRKMSWRVFKLLLGALGANCSRDKLRNSYFILSGFFQYLTIYLTGKSS